MNDNLFPVQALKIFFHCRENARSFGRVIEFKKRFMKLAYNVLSGVLAKQVNHFLSLVESYTLAANEYSAT